MTERVDMKRLQAYKLKKTFKVTKKTLMDYSIELKQNRPFKMKRRFY
jgi:hypothetical protein